jgi:hypothetical protein
MASFGFRLSNPEKFSYAFSIIETHSDGNLSFIYNSVSWFRKTAAVRLVVYS